MADFISDFGGGLGNRLIPTGDALQRKIDFQRDKFLKGISTTKHGKKEDPTYLYFKFIFDFGDTSSLDEEGTFLPISPLFRRSSDGSLTESDYEAAFSKRVQEQVASNQAGPTGGIPNPTTVQQLTDPASAGGFGTDTDFFYGSKFKLNGMINTGAFPVHQPLAYVGAQEFLKRRSDKRSQMIEAFKNGLDHINRNCPYYFQSLSGLETLLKVDIQNYHKKGSAPRRAGTLTIDCLESIDMRLSAIAELYRKAIYDYTHHRIMLPENLRKFRMYLVITEIRNIQLTYGINDILNPFSIGSVAQAANFLDSFNSQTGLLDEAAGLLQKSTNSQNIGADKVGSYDMMPYAWIYKLDQCEFDFDETYPSFGTIDNKGGQQVSTKFKIHVGRVKDYKIQFNQLADTVKKDNNIQQMVLADIWGGPNSPYNSLDYVSTQGLKFPTEGADSAGFFAQLASDFITNTVADLKNQGVSIVEGELLGNIYGFQLSNLQQGAQSVQGLSGLINGGVPTPFSDTRPQTQGLGGPGERAYPAINDDVYLGVPEPTPENLGNVLPGSGQPGTPTATDVYGNVPGSDLGLPDRTYPVNNDDQYGNTPGSDLGVPGRVYPPPGGDQYQDVPGTDLGLPNRIYPSNNDDQYNNVPGAELGVPGRVYPPPGGDQYTDVPGADLGLPNRTYPVNNDDQYPDVPGAELGVPGRVYPSLNDDQYPDVPGADLGLPNRTYPGNNDDQYPDVPGAELGAPNRIYSDPSVDLYPTSSGPDLGLPARQYTGAQGDEYPGVPGLDLGVLGRVYNEPNEDVYPTSEGSDLGLPDREYKNPGGDEYPGVPGEDLGLVGRVYDEPVEDIYQTSDGPDLGLPSRVYPSINSDEYQTTTSNDVLRIGRVYPNTNSQETSQNDNL
jgi:hypothetical protein